MGKSKQTTEPGIVIDQEFKSLFPPLSEEERLGLEDSLVADGCTDPIFVWPNGGDDILVDGHNRYEICCEHGISHRVVRMKFADRDEAKRWMILRQFGRRNLSDTAKAKLRGIAFNTTKGTRGGDHGNQHTVAKGHGDTLPDTAASVAEKTGVSKETVKRDAKTAEHLAAIAAVAPELEQAIVAEDVDATRAEIKQLAEATPAQVKKVAAKVADGETDLTDVLPAKKAKKEPTAEEPFPDVWAEKPRFAAAIQALGKLKTEVEKLWQTPAGAFLSQRRNEVTADFNSLKAALKFSAPHQVCPYCKGKGCKMQKGESTPCMGLGWTTRTVTGDGT